MGFRECLEALIVCTGNGEIFKRMARAICERVASANNDLAVLNHSLLFHDLLDDIAPVVPYEVTELHLKKVTT
ncbi:hypothetical protein Tco_0219619 [Tanacetum coccineum]